MHAMFTMMNEARLGVGVQGLALSEVAYQNAVAYAKERLQGRALTGAKYPDKPADPIIVHPDVRRMLMTIKSFNEAARALVVWTALTSDLHHRSEDEKARQAADDHMGLLTPVIKGVLTDTGFANTVLAQQMFGGHGYIAEHGMEQFVRDARIAMIYEGANGIQALDLVGRKLPKDGGRALQAFFAEVQGFIKEQGADAAMKPYVEPVGKALGHLQQATMWFMQNAMAKPDNAGAGSTDYMHIFGLCALGYMWARMAAAAHAKLKAGANGASARMNAKLVTGRFFMERMLPETAAQLAPHPGGRGEHDGIAGRDVLIEACGGPQTRFAKIRVQRGLRDRRLAAGSLDGSLWYQLPDRWPGNPGFLAHHQFQEACENGNQSRPEHHRFRRVQQMTEAVEMRRAVIGEIEAEAKKCEPGDPPQQA